MKKNALRQHIGSSFYAHLLHRTLTPNFSWNSLKANEKTDRTNILHFSPSLSNFKTTNHAIKVPYRKMLFLDVILASYESAKPVGKEPVLVWHMKTLQNKECLFSLTMSPLSEYRRQYHKWPLVNLWKRMLYVDISDSSFYGNLLNKTLTPNFSWSSLEANKKTDETDVLHISPSLLNFKTTIPAIKVTYRKMFYFEAILGSLRRHLKFTFLCSSSA